MPRCSNNTNIFQADLPSWRSFSVVSRRYDLTFRVNSSIRWMFSIDLGHQIRTQHPGGFPDWKFTNQSPSQPGARRRLETPMKFELWRLFEVLAALAVFLFTQSGDGVFLLNHRNSWYNWPDLHHIFISWANQDFMSINTTVLGGSGNEGWLVISPSQWSCLNAWRKWLNST